MVGSVLSAVEVKIWFGMHSTWVIKQNTDFFPMMAIHSILKARYGDRPAGHWVVFQMEIAEVQILAIGCAWSQSSVTYFVSTCGSMHPADEFYEAHYKDKFGVVSTCQIARLHLLEWV